MLTRQLASAGSGKTFTLARQFIRLFITVPTEEGELGSGAPKRRLRTRAELTDSLRHILAITFTNKATGEMKERIISKLADIANYKSSLPEGRIPTEEEAEAERKQRKEIAYLDDFVEELGVSPKEVAATAGEALEVLLNDFSDFQVSTIDSFFQLVMRTFTYEADLPDNFQLELDTNYIAGLGLDSALTDLNTNRSSHAFRYWSKKTVDSELNDSGKWNLFTPGSHSIYTKVLNMIKTMESEGFKETLQDLRDYFDSVEGQGDPVKGGRLGEIFAHYDDKYSLPLREAASKVREAARDALAYMDRAKIDSGDLAAYLLNRLRNMAKLNWKKPKDVTFKPEALLKPTAMKKGIDCDPVFLEKVHALGNRLSRYVDLAAQPEIKSWSVYSGAFRQLALTWEIKKKIDELMRDSNSLQLSDTNSILHTIIGDDETPFIYERLGSRLDHFLIDEFQDTSGLQWLNTLPLLRESESRGKENLIIGDPKQSIYRFRNADSSLITSAVKREFPNLHDAGADPKTNTNWRSALNIVRFNNFLFHSLAVRGMDYSDSYADVIQFSPEVNQADPSKTKAEGYVCMRFYRKDKSEDYGTKTETEEDGDIMEYPEYFSEIGHIITDLRKRGFRQRDIAVLVDTHNAGANVIDSLLDFNASIDKEDPESPEPIRFVSEDSLKVTNAQGVRTIIEALKAINGTLHFTRPAIPDAEDMPHSEKELQDPIDEFSRYADRSNPCISDELREMLKGMSVVTLPAIVEQIIRTFVPMPVREAEAPFLAALQDSVLEFTENHIPDIASFLKWWDKHGDTLSISSPETTDAVQVVTVHASKGLEFGAVIVPNANYLFRKTPNRGETVWLSPALPVEEEFPLPPALPIEITGQLEGTYHQAELDENKKAVATDKLNAAYVAFTRAKYELHILSEVSKTKWPGESKPKTEPSIPAFESLVPGIFAVFDDLTSSLGSVPKEKMAYVVDPKDFRIDRGTLPSLDGRTERETIRMTYGMPVILNTKSAYECSQTATAPEEETEDSRGPKTETVSDYTVNDSLPTLHFLEETPLIIQNDTDEEILDKTDSPDPDDEIEEDEILPGTERALLRELLTRLGTKGDIDRAMLAMRAGGRWSETLLDEAEGMFRRLLEIPEVKAWFVADKDWTVFVGRPIIHRRNRTRTPDRLMISADGSRAVLVNFKLTAEPDEGEWRQLAVHLRAFRRTGFTGPVEAWLVHPLTASAERLTAERITELRAKFGN